ncbi:MAG: hypothetical protein H6726_00345 [Sandaracinaceae bacterium]|nr:hypothetical protein [Myxococcales bacterium]MCB9656067.1 hypothetical protein [Sandaracinaceae bacterium]
MTLAAVPGCHCGSRHGGGDGGPSDAAALDQSDRPDQPRDDGGVDPDPCTLSGRNFVVRLDQVDDIDLLFMMDDSPSMRQEQAAIVQEIPRLVEVLASGDRDGDGTEDFRPLATIQLGVITSNMGVGGVRLPATARCASALGDDGVLLTRPRGTDSSCADSYPPFLSFASETDDPAEFAAAAGCLAVTGQEGCAFEQQLEAVLKALTPAESTVRFEHERGGVLVRSTQGHGGSGLNHGFLRDTSLLAVVMITDEDDCSSRDLDLYDLTPPSQGTAQYPVPTDANGNIAPNLQCSTYRNVQYDVLKRHVAGLLALRPDAADLLVFAVIAGVDPDALAAHTSIVDADGHVERSVDFAALLSDPTMQEVVNVAQRDILPGCTRPDPDAPDDPLLTNIASPPRRLVSVAAGLDQQGAHGVVASICQSRDPLAGDHTADFTPAFDDILLAVANALPPGCIDEELARSPTGEVSCVVLETLPPGLTCASQQGRGREPTPVRVEGNGAGARETCRVAQVAPTPADVAEGRDPSGTGWFYDDYTTQRATRCSPGRQAVVFSAGAGPTVDAEVVMECYGAAPATDGRADVGTGCVVDPTACDLSGTDLASLRAQYRRPDATLVCAGEGNCHLSCATDGDCPGLQVCTEEDGGSVCRDASCSLSGP